MAGIEAFREANECAQTLAAIMAIGTANPHNIVEQSAFPDFYFRITMSEHKQQLKEELRRICQDSSIRKRHLLVSEEMVKQNPSICSFSEPSLDARQAVVIEEIPKLAKEAAAKAIKEWGRPKSDITHLIFSSASAVDIPGADYYLWQLLGLPTSVKRLMLYNVGSHAGGTVLRVAKDIAENDKRARVLVVCAELSLLFFRGPHQEHIGDLAVQAVLGDGASALVVGADPVQGIEKPIFYVAAASQVTLPDAGDVIQGHLREVGLEFHQKSQQLPALLCNNIEKPLAKLLASLGISDDWNSLFWVVHPDCSAVLDQLEAELGLEHGKLAASRRVLSEYGNMMCSSVFFVLDEMRKSAVAETHSTTGEGLQWGFLVGFGPGLSIETLVLQSVPV